MPANRLKETAVGGQDYFRLRAEWLRLKHHVFDMNTELPTIDAVLDDVRRLLEERGTLALIYLDLAGGTARLEALHGWSGYDDIVRSFARSLQGLRDGILLGPKDIIAVMGVRSDKFLLFLGGAHGNPVGPRSIEGIATQVRSRILLSLSHEVVPHAPPLAFHDGFALLRRDPMLRAERSVHRALDEAMYMSLRHRTRDDDRRAMGLDAIIREQKVTTLYQPIVDLSSLRAIGHEVFTRGPVGGPFEDSEGLFALAERTGRLVEFERLCRRRALSTARSHLSRGEILFLNTSAGALTDPGVAGDAFVEEVERHGLEHSEVVLEITERVTVSDRRAHREVLRHLKENGFGIAIDDMGAGYSSLKSVVEIEPDFMKFDISLVRNIDRSLIKRSLLETLVDLSEKIGARVIAEGIEMQSEFETLRELGVELGQGRFLAPPLPVPEA